MRRLVDLMEYQQRLRECESVGDLFATAAQETAARCGFDRALVLTVSGRTLVADESDHLRTSSADLLRRAVLQRPIALRSGSLEAELLRRECHGRPSAPRASVVGEALGLRHFSLGVVAPERSVLGFLVVDRPVGDVVEEERDAVSAHAAALACVLERRLLLERLNELGREMRHLTVSAQAMTSELTTAPLLLASQRAPVVRFPQVVPAVGAVAADVLTSRELDVLSLLVDGLSNREIAERLVVSSETVKARVASILRKLNAANRVDAVARYLRLEQDRDGRAAASR